MDKQTDKQTDSQTNRQIMNGRIYQMDGEHNGRLYRAKWKIVQSTTEDCTEPTTQWKIVQSQLHNGRLYRANWFNRKYASMKNI